MDDGATAKLARKADKLLEDVLAQSLTLKKRPAQALLDAVDATIDAVASGSESDASCSTCRELIGSDLATEEVSEGIASGSDDDFSDDDEGKGA